MLCVYLANLYDGVSYIFCMNLVRWITPRRVAVAPVRGRVAVAPDCQALVCCEIRAICLFANACIRIDGWVY